MGICSIYYEFHKKTLNDKAGTLMSNLSLIRDSKSEKIIPHQKEIKLVKRRTEVSETGKVIFSLQPPKTYGVIIKKIASSFWYVFEDAKIHLIADEMTQNPDIWVVAVVDKNLTYLGVILRRDLFNILGKQFGRDLHIKKTAGELCHDAITFNHNKNIFTVANDITNTFNKHSNTYYVLLDGKKFEGVFSSKDMLIYLSEITQEDLNLAKKLQSCLVKESDEFETERCGIVAASYMAKGLGGDFYMIKKTSETKWTINICDVSGKGISAALISSILGAMSSMYNPADGIKKFIMNLNSFIFSTFKTEKFITGIFLEFDEVTGEVLLFDLGHSYINIFRDNKMFNIKHQVENIPLGINPDMIPKSGKFKLEKGDIMMLYTDGFEEQKNPRGETYGSTRLFNLVKRNSLLGIKNIKNELLSDFMEFRDEYPQQDDISLILLEYADV